VKRLSENEAAGTADLIRRAKSLYKKCQSHISGELQTPGYNAEELFYYHYFGMTKWFVLKVVTLYISSVNAPNKS